jgi:hypothetical protein
MEAITASETLMSTANVAVNTSNLSIPIFFIYILRKFIRRPIPKLK